MTGLLVLVFCIVLLILSITVFKVHPLPTLLISGLILGLATGSSVEAFTESPDIDVEHLDLCIRPVLFDKERVLNGVHAAHVAAIGVALVGARTDTLDEGDGLGNLVI